MTNNPIPNPAARNPTLWLLIAAALVLRVGGAWLYRHSYNPDYGIVGLMVRHIAAGRAFPIFFYGQDYMGSLEPAFSALLGRLFGVTGFTVCLGTALLGAAITPVVYAWGRDMGGRTAGAAAALFCLVGPDGYFHYLASPRGGYAVTLLFGTLILWQACRVGRRERAGAHVPGAWYGVLGLLAGLGIWSNFLIAPALGAAGLVYLGLAGVRRVLSLRAAWALAGAAVGGLPLWWWNLRHGGASFTMAQSAQRFGDGLRLFWTARLPALLDLAETTRAARIGLAAVLVLGAVAAAVALRPRARVKAGGAVDPAMLACAWLYLAVFVPVFSLSGFSAFATPRYLLPLVPVFGVLAGAATVTLRGAGPRPAWRRAAAWLPLLVLAGWQAATLPRHVGRAARYAGAVAHAHTLAERLEDHALDAVYTPYLMHGLNFLLDEAFTFADIKHERYPPYARRVEQAARVGVLNGHGGVAPFVDAAGGSVAAERVGIFRLYHSLEAPADPVRPLGAARLSRVTAPDGRDVTAMVGDGALDTGVDVPPPGDTPEWIAAHFDAPARICGVRIVSPQLRLPQGWRVEGLRDGRWSVLMDTLPTASFFWSGPRPYWDGDQFRLESRFAPRECEAVRVGFLRAVAGAGYRVAELRVLEPDGAPAAENAVAALCVLLAERGITRLWADRWPANRVHERTGGAVRVNLDPGIFGADAPLPARIDPAPGAAVLVDRGDAPWARRCFAARGLDGLRETPVGPWVLFECPAHGEGPGRPGLLFRGGTCLLGESRRWAAWLMQQGATVALEDLEAAARACPDYAPVMERLAERLEAAGRDADAAAWRAEAARLTRPAVPAAAAFEGGLHFAGLTLESDAVRPGGHLALRYFWTCAPEYVPAGLAVFVHFVGPDGARFQDDHLVLDGVETAFQPFPEVFTESRRVPVPTDMPPGDYALWIGLCRAVPPRCRVRPHTTLEHRKRAVRVPVAVHVLKEEE
jgi:4-amino-4-deoxy-L-arabinose transferase-like glycosyltransferase